MDSALREVASAINTAPTSIEGLHPGLQDFCRAVQKVLRQGQDKTRLAAVREHLQALLRDASFLKAHCGPDAQPGLHVLYQDPEIGFQVIAHVNDKGRTSPPHDHGDSWAIYGQAVGHTDMTDWQQLAEDGPGGVRLERMTTTAKYRLAPGDAGLFSHGAIHCIDYPAESRFVRVTGVDLDGIARRVFDPLTGAARSIGKPRAS